MHTHTCCPPGLIGQVQHPFGAQRVGMLAGGTGLTPMIQASGRGGSVCGAHACVKDTSAHSHLPRAMHPRRPQALHAILGNDEDTTTASLVWSNRRKQVRSEGCARVSGAHARTQRSVSPRMYPGHIGVYVG